MDLTPSLSSEMPILVMCPIALGIEFVGFALDPGADPAPERVMTVYFPAPIAPRPSHAEECPVCIELTSGLGFDFPCGHLVCWDCARSWANQSRANQSHDQSMPCPMCRNAMLRPGDYFSSQTQVEIVMIGRFSCVLAYSERVAHIALPFATIEIVSAVSTDWWATYYSSDEARLPVRMVLKAAAEMHHRVVAETLGMVNRRCGWCGAPRSSSRCMGCKTVYYCSVRCQRLHWKAHKDTCVKRGRV
jgi:hypothetical protein